MAAPQKIVVTFDPQARHLLERIATALEKQQKPVVNPEQLASPTSSVTRKVPTSHDHRQLPLLLMPLNGETISAAMNNRRFHEEQRHREAKIETDT